MTQTITALFDSRAEADRALEQLVQQVGLDRSSIQLHASETSTATEAATPAKEGGFWSSLTDLFMPDDDRSTYSEGVRRGGTVLTTKVEDAQADQVMDLLEAGGSVDLSEREAEWRQTGWTGAQAEAPVATSPVNPALGVASTGVVGASSGVNTAAAAILTTATTSGAATTARAGQEEVIPVVEETLKVGKRAAEGGRVRVRSYIVETPVTEQVSLREEHVDVARRAVDRPLADGDRAFEDRTIEATEHAEEAVTSKEARVVEELVIRKDATERTETINDTVRRQEVEIEDTRTPGSAATSTNTTRSNPER